MLPLTSARQNTEHLLCDCMVHFSPLASYWSSATLASILIATSTRTAPGVNNWVHTFPRNNKLVHACRSCSHFRETHVVNTFFGKENISILRNWKVNEGNLSRFRAWPGFHKIKRRKTAQNDSEGKTIEIFQHLSIASNTRLSLTYLITWGNRNHSYNHSTLSWKFPRNHSPKKLPERYSVRRG